MGMGRLNLNPQNNSFRLYIPFGAGLTTAKGKWEGESSLRSGGSGTEGKADTSFNS